jgi:hypothetical protein
MGREPRVNPGLAAIGPSIAFHRPLSSSFESRTRFGGATYTPLFIYLLVVTVLLLIL